MTTQTLIIFETDPEDEVTAFKAFIEAIRRGGGGLTAAASQFFNSARAVAQGIRDALLDAEMEAPKP